MFAFAVSLKSRQSGLCGRAGLDGLSLVCLSSFAFLVGKCSMPNAYRTPSNLLRHYQSFLRLARASKIPSSWRIRITSSCISSRFPVIRVGRTCARRVFRSVMISEAAFLIVLFLTSVLRLVAGMISLSELPSMGGDIFLVDCGKDFWNRGFLLGFQKRSEPAPIGTGPSQTALVRFMTPGP